MNKYTLSFYSSTLEEKYQIYRLQSTIPACKIINVMCFLVCALRSIISLIIGDYINLIVFASLGFVVILLHIIVIMYKVTWIDFYLVGINHILMFYQLYVEYDFKPEEAYVFGQSMMVIHMIIILVSDFKYALIQIFMGTGIRLGLCGLFQEDTSFQTYIFNSLLAFMLTYTIYKTNKQYRESFLYTSNNNSLDWLIPIIVQNPFIMFYYDQTNVGFQIKLSNFQKHNLFGQNEDSQQVLNYILRNFLISGSPQQKTLEKFVLSRQITNRKYYMNKSFTLINWKNRSDKMAIKYSEIFVTELTFIIVIDKQEQQVTQLKLKLQRVERGMFKFLHYTKSFLFQQMSLINLIKHQTPQLYQAKVKFLYIFIKFQIQKKKDLEECSLISVMNYFIKLFQKAYKRDLKIFFNNEIENIKTYKNEFQELMIVLMTFLHRLDSNQIRFNICNSYVDDLNFIDIIVLVDQPNTLYNMLSQNIHFQKILQILSPNEQILMLNNNVVIRLYKDMNQLKQMQAFKLEKKVKLTAYS